MIGKLASRTAESFITRPNTCYDKIEIYQYGFFVLYSNIVFLLFTIVLGIVLNIFLSSLIFYITFFSIRQYAGGYHATTETRCEILSTLSITLCIALIKLSTIYDLQTVLFISALVSAFCIFFRCPLDTPEKPLTEKEFWHFRKISWLILLVLIFAVLGFYFAHLKWLHVFFAPCCLSMMLECSLLIAGELKKLSNK